MARTFLLCFLKLRVTSFDQFYNVFGMKMWQVLQGCVKRVSNKTMFLMFGCLLIVVILYNFILKDYLYPSAPVLIPPGKSKYHDPDYTKSDECLMNYFEDILLVIVYHFPFYDSIPLLKSFYKDAFKDILICGPQSHLGSYVMVVDVGPGLYGYECAGEAIRSYPGYRGYLYVNDDMIVNWWTFSNLDKEKFWQGGILIVGDCHVMGSRPIAGNWPWWKFKSNSAEACEDSYLEITHNYRSSEYINITKLINTHLINGEGEKLCYRTWSDLFYVPKKFSDQFQRLSFVFHKNRVFLEVAVPTIMSFLDLRDSWEKHYGIYLPDKYGSIDFADGKLVWKNYNYDINFIHPVKFHGEKAKTNREKLRNDIIPYSKQFTKCQK